ncbi:MAG: maleylpyruvate isomerase family mycothiol-dependent enzyme [Acidimicrobiia bacterium]|nr:maleylpyruvate isomerase family mycothiol-dependent enzyme [Acidimicrobiia bacterium]NNF64718.1 maleylpyruvate isomerase family mycothiol-dependent enzyme [Acidimicrobiia bacterium]
MREILADLVAEQQALDQYLQRIRERDWNAPTPAKGWDVRATVSHLAYTENFAGQAMEHGQSVIDDANITDIDEWTARGVNEGKDKRYQEVIEWWRHGRAAVVDQLYRRLPSDRVPWVYGDMSAKSLATMRLMETWAHGLDIKDAVPVKISEDEEDPTADTPRLRHVAWLAHRTLPRAFELAGEEYPASGIRVELVGPNYARWVYGPEDSEHVIKGIAGDFCRVAVCRMSADDTGLKAISESAETALRVIKAY